MQYYIDFDKDTGKILGFYVDAVHKNIPPTALKITREMHQYAVPNYVKIDILKITETTKEIDSKDYFIEDFTLHS